MKGLPYVESSLFPIYLNFPHPFINLKWYYIAMEKGEAEMYMKSEFKTSKGIFFLLFSNERDFWIDLSRTENNHWSASLIWSFIFSQTRKEGEN